MLRECSPQPGVKCDMSLVTFQLSHVRCQESSVMCHVCFLLSVSNRSLSSSITALSPLLSEHLTNLHFMLLSLFRLPQLQGQMLLPFLSH